MKFHFLSLFKNRIAPAAKFFLIFVITPATARFQKMDLMVLQKNGLGKEEGEHTFFQRIIVFFVRFLSWFCQGMITLAYPAMGYSPVESRREKVASQWASDLLGVPSFQLEQEAQQTLFQIQQSLFHTSSTFAIHDDDFSQETCLQRNSETTSLQNLIHSNHDVRTDDDSNRPPNFTVLICFHHHLDYFKSCLESIKIACAHSPESSVEILIINDDPLIHSELLLAEVAAQMLQDKVTLYSHQQNLGICHSANQAIACAKGRWILHLDCDDRLSPEVFSTLEKVIKQKPHIRFISSRAIDIDGRGRVLSWRLRSEQPSDLIHNNVASHLKAIRKDLHQDLGEFNTIFEGCQDYEFALRIAVNEPLCFIPDYLYQYRWHDQSQTVSNNKRQNLTANRIRQTYLLALYWMNHGTNGIEWHSTGTHAASWIHHFPASSLPIRYKVIVEANTPYEEHRWKLLIIQLATIAIDGYRNKEEKKNINLKI